MKQHVFEKSSQVNCIRYFDDTKILEIDFKQNKVYQYFDVPETVYEAALSAESIGKFINQNVKNKFEYKQIPF